MFFCSITGWTFSTRIRSYNGSDTVKSPLKELYDFFRISAARIGIVTLLSLLLQLIKRVKKERSTASMDEQDVFSFHLVLLYVFGHPHEGFSCVCGV